MFWIVENDKQLELFSRLKYEKVFLEPILANDNIHPALNRVIAIYIKGLGSHKGYMLCLDHSETTSCSNFKLDYDEIYVRNKKLCTYFFDTRKFKDVHFIRDVSIDITTPAHTHLNAKYARKSDVNRIIPIVKHYERCESIYKEVEGILSETLPSSFDFYNRISTNCFYWIEKNGLGVDKRLLKEKLELNEDIYSLNGKSIYSQYNLYTTTKRPSNSFNGINYAALNKDNGARRTFVPKNDDLVEIDISAYHPTLIANLIGYKFEEEDIHQHFADLYGVSYKESKELTFKQLYGGVFKEYSHIEFFKKTKKYINKLHQEYNENGYIEVPISGYRFEKEKLGNIGAQKLFNYLLQNLETANNVRILVDIIRILKNAKTNLILYTYDAFLFDRSNTEKDVFSMIMDVFNKRNLNIKVSYGKDYDSLQRA